MVKEFQFDDEVTQDVNETEIDKSFNTQPFVFDDDESNNVSNTRENSDINESQELQSENESVEEVDDMAKTKEKKKFVWKWWHYVLLGLLALCVAFFMYIFIVSRNDGPVYGKTRCEGLAVAIDETTLNTLEEEMKSSFETIDKIELAVECKTVKVDIYFKEKMNTTKAKEIALETIYNLDDKVGLEKADGEEFSYLFGVHNNVQQYEVNFCLYSENNDDFPIFGTKHVQNDNVSFTLHSIKDKTSADKAQATLND